MVKKTVVFKKLKSAVAKRWFLRHINDPYVQQASADNYRNRAAYKLKQIQDKYKILAKNDYVLDLGAAPGGWSQVVLSKIGVNARNPRLIGLDLLSIEPLKGANFIQKNFFDEDVYEVVYDMISRIRSNVDQGYIKSDLIDLNNVKNSNIKDINGGDDEEEDNEDYRIGHKKGVQILEEIRRDSCAKQIKKGLFNVILSDMSPNVSGNKSLDHMRIIAFIERIIGDFFVLLKPQGNFVAKLFDGSELRGFVAHMRTLFRKVYIFKPKASRKNSSEIYCICLSKL